MSDYTLLGIIIALVALVIMVTVGKNSPIMKKINEILGITKKK